MSQNEALARVLHEMSQLMDLLGMDSFRSGAHARAARAVEGLAEDVASLAQDRTRLLAIEGIGAKTADKITEFCSTGAIREHAELVAQVPGGMLQLLEIPGLGPKTIRAMWNEGGITDLAGLERAIADGSILKLPRMGAKSVEKIRQSIAFVKEQAASGAARLSIGIARPIADRAIGHLRRAIEGAIGAWGRDIPIAFAGSLRRGKETIGDIDVLVAPSDAEQARLLGEAFRAMPGVTTILVAGETKSSVRMRIDGDLGRWGRDSDATGASIQVDLKIVPPESWGAAMMYFTGSKEHNIAMRERARTMGWTLNEYGLYPDDDPKKQLEPPQKRGLRSVADASTEESLFRKLGVPWIPPECREDRGEFEVKQSPRLVEVADIKAELHAHTTASDGRMSIEELAERAKERGFHTIAVTDHSRSSAVAGGLTVERLLEHVDAVRAAQAKVATITILAGSEVDILADGELDYPDEILKRLDVVVASPHTALSQDSPTATARLIRAIENPHVNILGHPTGRLINKRPGLSPDMGVIFAAAKKHDVALEINTHWMRLDLRDVHARAAADAGCLVAIDSDVHEAQDFDNLRYGVMTARRGWVTPERCVNCWPAEKLHEWLKKKR
jgi:DNA polymerase (family X)